MTRDKALAFAKVNIESLEYKIKYDPPNDDIKYFEEMIFTLKAFIETDRKYEALKLTSNIKQEPTE